MVREHTRRIEKPKTYSKIACPHHPTPPPTRSPNSDELFQSGKEFFQIPKGVLDLLQKLDDDIEFRDGFEVKRNNLVANKEIIKLGENITNYYIDHHTNKIIGSISNNFFAVKFEPELKAVEMGVKLYIVPPKVFNYRDKYNPSKFNLALFTINTWLETNPGLNRETWKDIQVATETYNKIIEKKNRDLENKYRFDESFNKKVEGKPPPVELIQRLSYLYLNDDKFFRNHSSEHQ